MAAVTAHDETPGRLRAAGFCAYVRKPVAPREVVRAVERCLGEVMPARPRLDLARPERPRAAGASAG